MKPICKHHKPFDKGYFYGQWLSSIGREQRKCPECGRWLFYGEFGKGWRSAIRAEGAKIEILL